MRNLEKKFFIGFLVPEQYTQNVHVSNYYSLSTKSDAIYFKNSIKF
jgi:hypothetical protein